MARAATARALCGTGGANDSMRGIRVNRVNSCEDDVCGVDGRRKTLCETKRSPTMVLTNERSNTTINSDVDSVGLSVGRLLYVSWWGYRGLSVRPSVGRQSINCFSRRSIQNVEMHHATVFWKSAVLEDLGFS